MRVAARAETEIVGVRRKPNVERKNPQLAEKLEDTLFGSQR